MVALSAFGLRNTGEEGPCSALNCRLFGGIFAQPSANQVADFSSQPGVKPIWELTGPSSVNQL